MDSTRSTIPLISNAIRDSAAAKTLAVAVTVSQLPPVTTSCHLNSFESAVFAFGFEFGDIDS